MTIRKHDADDAGEEAASLRVICGAQVVARPANRIISLRPSQPEGKHDSQ